MYCSTVILMYNYINYTLIYYYNYIILSVHILTEKLRSNKHGFKIVKRCCEKSNQWQ